MRMYVLPYKAGSRSARVLSGQLGTKRIKLQNSRFRHTARKTVINWGRCDPHPQVDNSRVLNPCEKVSIACNKLQALHVMDAQGVSVPDYTTDYEVAHQWIQEGTKVVGRHMLRGNSGAGIVIYDGTQVMASAPLYTKYIPKTHEYRVHVVQGRVIDTQRKMRNRDVPDDQVNWAIRNHSNGFIFGREGVHLADVARDQSLAAVAALQLDFGAVDLIYNEHRNRYYVLEVNTAPGLEGTTLDKYTQAFLNY